MSEEIIEDDDTTPTLGSGSKCKIMVQTTDYKGFEKESDFHIILYDDTLSREYTFNHSFRRGALDTFEINLPTNLGRVTKIKIWYDNHVLHKWHVEFIKVKQLQYTDEIIFPILRWLQPDSGNGENHHMIMEFDTILPQFDPNQKQRQREIDRRRGSYEIKYVNGNIPMLKELPSNEQFTAAYVLSLGFKYVSDNADALIKELWIVSSGWNYFAKIYAPIKEWWFNRHKWNSFDEIDNVYDRFMSKPKSADYWSNDSWFGNQRLVGCNPAVITLCTKIPKKFGVTEDMMKPVLHDETLASLIKKKRLFYTDLAALDGLKKHENFELCAPMALFMLDDKDQLLPIAIQLNQEKGTKNPVFLPTDHVSVWLLAKMWYNNAETGYHQAILHLGGTHLLMEGVIAALQRNLTISHPILKLLEPHTLFLFAINSVAMEKLLSKDGWINTTMSIGASNTYELVSKFNPTWRFDLHGTPPAEFKSRNVEDPKVLPNYHFRDDSLLIYEAIHKYVKDYVQLYYHDDQTLLCDTEIQNWAKELAQSTSIPNGIGMAGIPVRNGAAGFYTIDELVIVLSAVIYTCSAGHGAVNFLQYKEYGYPPNYPAQLRGKLIRDKERRTEADFLKSVPNLHITLRIMVLTDILSQKDTHSLGYFETQYIHDPKALKVLETFRADLKEVSAKIRGRNKQLQFPYEVLLPENIPNAISI